jgi:anthranilate synthase component 2
MNRLLHISIINDFSWIAVNIIEFLCLQYMGEVGANFEVYRNDDITVEEIKKISPRGILISPGPGTPQDSGISLQTVQDLGPSTPLFGVCMGLQCIGEAFGGKVVRSPYGVVHGKGSLVHYEEKLDGTLFSGLPK